MRDPISIDNIYVTGDLAFFISSLYKKFSSPKWCFKYKLHGRNIGEDWTINILSLVLESNSTGSARLGVKEAPNW